MDTLLTRTGWRAAGLVGLVFIAGCGGGGGGDGYVIAPFDLQTGVVATDLDGDGRSDVAVANTYVAGPPPHPGSVRVFLHDSTSARGFRAPVRHDVGADPWALTAADLTGDGLVDLAVATPDSDRVWLLPHDPARPGSFGTARSYATPRAPYQVAAADLDGDGRTDMAVALNSLTPGGVALLLQNPLVPGDFAGAVHVPLGAGGANVVAADVDGDGRNDLLLAAASSDPARAGLYLALQDPLVAGTFRPAIRLAAGQKPTHVAVADLDADGHPDLVVANDAIDARGSGITVLLADAARPGQFHAGTFHAMNDIAVMSCVADVDGDARPDIVVAAQVSGLTNDAESVVQVFLQDRVQPGRFLRASRHDSGDLASFIAVADLDGDGRPDVVTGEGPKVLCNDPASPGSFQPASAL